MQLVDRAWKPTVILNSCVAQSPHSSYTRFSFHDHMYKWVSFCLLTKRVISTVSDFLPMGSPHSQLKWFFHLLKKKKKNTFGWFCKRLPHLFPVSLTTLSHILPTMAIVNKSWFPKCSYTLKRIWWRLIAKSLAYRRNICFSQIII